MHFFLILICLYDFSFSKTIDQIVRILDFLQKHPSIYWKTDRISGQSAIHKINFFSSPNDFNFLLCVCARSREEWMYKLAQVGNDMTFLHHVRKFIAASKKHRVSLGRECTIWPCNSCQSKLLQEDNVVQSHLIRHDFVKDYIVRKFCGEGDPSVTGASERNSSMT